jgi:hypothetical protein
VFGEVLNFLTGWKFVHQLPRETMRRIAAMVFLTAGHASSMATSFRR